MNPDFEREQFAQPMPIETERIRVLPDLPKGLPRLLDDYDRAFDAWTAAVAEREDSEAAILDAERADAEALRAAILAGNGDPGTAASDAAIRAAYVAQERLRLALAELSRAFDKVWVPVKANGPALLVAAAALEQERIAAITTKAAAITDATTRLAKDAREIGTVFDEVAMITGTNRGAGLNPNWPAFDDLERVSRNAAAWYAAQIPPTPATAA